MPQATQFLVIAKSYFSSPALDENGDQYLETKESIEILSRHRYQHIARNRVEKIMARNHGVSPYDWLGVVDSKNLPKFY